MTKNRSENKIHIHAEELSGESMVFDVFVAGVFGARMTGRKNTRSSSSNTRLFSNTKDDGRDMSELPLH
jgi:hypothetical protein